MSANEQDFDVIVVGSGFGGSVMACRLAEGGNRVCVLERGKAYPPGSFPRSPLGMRTNMIYDCVPPPNVLTVDAPQTPGFDRDNTAQVMVIVDALGNRVDRIEDRQPESDEPRIVIESLPPDPTE